MMLLAGLVAVTACEQPVNVDGGVPGQPIDILSPEVTLVAGSDKYESVCYIPAEGKTFSVFPKYCGIWEVQVDGVWAYPDNSEDGVYVCSGDWGCISERIIKGNPHKIVCEIAKNPSTKSRTIVLDLQAGYDQRRVRIEQAAGD